MKLRAVIAMALASVAARLVALHFLHPLNWDELEFFRATTWIAEGRLPYRDFWEHHTPLVWALFAPLTWLTNSPGVDAIVFVRWLQVPVWAAALALTNVWMRDHGIERFARWTAMALALTSSLFMLSAVEYRVEAVACALFILGAVLVQRDRAFLGGAAWCLVGLANLRFAPLVATYAFCLLLTRERRRVIGVIAGGLAMLAAALAFFAITHSLHDLYTQVWIDNQAEKYYAAVEGRFWFRLLTIFGVRLVATDRLFEIAAVDVGGVVIVVLGTLGLLLTIVRRWRSPDPLLALAIASIANLAFIARMKFIYNYHFAAVVIAALPLMAFVLQRVKRTQWLVAMIAVTCAVNVFAAVFRGKELDLAYQDRILREMHARTVAGEKIWSGAAWPFRRAPAYRYWFLPELVGQIVLHRLGPRYELASVIADPPAAVVFDHNTFTWMTAVQRELTPYFVRHYVPVWRELWMPGLNGRLRAGERLSWIVPRDGAYRVYVSAHLATHPWFRGPIATASYKRPDAARLTFRLPAPGAGPIVFDGDVAHLRKGQRLTAFNPSNETLAVFLLPTDDRVLFREPPPGATLEAETTRVTHVPDLFARYR